MQSSQHVCVLFTMQRVTISQRTPAQEHNPTKLEHKL